MTRILFLPDTGPAAGLGHARRCMVLADALRAAGASCVFVSTNPAISSLIEARGHGLAAEPVHDVQAVIGDDYAIDLAWCRSWARAGVVRILIDDLADRDIEAEIVVNQNIYARDGMYDSVATGRILAGIEYCMIEPRFAELAATRGYDADGVLFGFGGTEDGRHGLAVAERLIPSLPSVRCHIIASPLRPVWPGAERFADAHSNHVVLHRAPDVAAVMRQCRIYVGAFGSMVWEALAAGLAVAGCLTADNQRLVAAALAAYGVPVVDRFDPDGLAAVTETLIRSGGARQAVPQIDGIGGQRVAEAIMLACQEKVS